MIDIKSDDYKIAEYELKRSVATAICKFKEAVGCYRCSIETSNYDYDGVYNEHTGKFMDEGPSIGLNIYAVDKPSFDEGEDYGEDDE